jgi:hypothetical protein
MSYGLFVYAACLYAYHFVCIPMPFKSRNLLQIRTKYKIFNADSRPKFYVISNGVILFAVKSNII